MRFLRKNLAESVHQKLVPDLFLILVNNPKQPLHAIIILKIRYFETGLSKSLKKVFILFQTQSLLVGKIMKNNRDLKLVTIHASGYKTSPFHLSF